MAKTTQIRVYLEEAEQIELQRRRLSIERGGQRVTIADVVKWMINQLEAQRRTTRPEGER